MTNPIAFNVFFSRCGHLSQTEYRLHLLPLDRDHYAAPDSNTPEEQILVSDGGFCPDCWMSCIPYALIPYSPEPWKIPFPEETFGHSEFQESEVIFQNAAELIEAVGMDSLTFVEPENKMLSLEATEALKYVEWLLSSNVLWRIAHPETKQPTEAQRNFVLQLRTVLQFDLCSRIWTKKIGQHDRLAKLQAKVPKVNHLPLPENHPDKEKESGPKEDQNCPICTAQFLNPQESGQGEHGVRTACGHLFGQDCLFQWLQENSTCPSCRQVILSFEENHELETAEIRQMPSWLITIIGCDLQNAARDAIREAEREEFVQLLIGMLDKLLQDCHDNITLLKERQEQKYGHIDQRIISVDERSEQDIRDFERCIADQRIFIQQIEEQRATIIRGRSLANE